VALYSNSRTDVEQSQSARQTDETAVRAMYEHAPYPDLGADLKNLDLYLDPIMPDLAKREDVRFLDVGCGTGHILVGVAKSRPDWSCYGIDLSNGSLSVARELATKHDAPVAITRGSYLDPLPYDFSFDVISAIGTIHHCAEPVAALHNLKASLRDDGYLLLHLYGLRSDQEKFDIKEALSILEPQLDAYDNRFDFYKSLMDHKQKNWLKRLALTTPADVVGTLRAAWRNFGRRRQKISWSPSFRETFERPDAPWIDHFCHPCERAYEVPGVKAMLDEAGLEVVHMLKQGREHKQLIPAEWRARYSELDNWDKWRLSELLAIGGGSFAMVLKKAP